MRAVIFDMDGVIIDSEPLHYHVFHRYADELGITISDEEYNTFIGITDVEMFTRIKKNYDLNHDLSELVQMYNDRYFDYLSSFTTIKPITGVDLLIKDLYSNNVTLALASSSQRKNIDAILYKFELRQYFTAIVSGQDVDKSKPNPDIFLKAAELLKIEPGGCLVIEDSKNGTVAAKTAGMKCIGYKNSGSGEQDLSLADMIIKDFIEIDYEKLIVRKLLD